MVQIRAGHNCRKVLRTRERIIEWMFAVFASRDATAPLGAVILQDRGIRWLGAIAWGKSFRQEGRMRWRPVKEERLVHYRSHWLGVCRPRNCGEDRSTALHTLFTMPWPGRPASKAGRRRRGRRRRRNCSHRSDLRRRRRALRWPCLGGERGRILRWPGVCDAPA
jgi:hypothetical protein